MKLCCNNCRENNNCRILEQHPEKGFSDNFVCDFYLMKKPSGAMRRKRAKERDKK